MYGHLRRGVVSGLVGGGVYGVYVALVGNPLVARAEHVAHHGGEHGHEHAGEGAGLVSEGLTQVVSVGGSVALGGLFGLLVFGVAAYLFEPALPAVGGSYLLGLGGFLAVSGVPWLVLPPAAPGVDSSVSTTAALYLYVALVVVGAAACLGAGATFHRLAGRGRGVAAAGGLAVFVTLVGAAVLLAPTVTYEAAIPAGLEAAYTGVVVVGQLGLWGVTAAVHDRLGGASPDPAPTARPTAAD